MVYRPLPPDCLSFLPVQYTQVVLLLSSVGLSNSFSTTDINFNNKKKKKKKRKKKKKVRVEWKCIPDVGETDDTNLQVVGGTTQKDLLFSGGLLWWHDDLCRIGG
jgi:hypothetical protein